MGECTLNPLPYHKNLASQNLRAFADDKLYINPILRFVFHRVENSVEKRENAGYEHFLLFPQCFQKVFILFGRQKSS